MKILCKIKTVIDFLDLKDYFFCVLIGLHFTFIPVVSGLQHFESSNRSFGSKERETQLLT